MMAATTDMEPTLEPGVDEFIRRYNADARLRTVCDIVRTCFPEARSLRVRLVDDPDEEGRTWVVVQPSLPASHPLDLLQKQHTCYHKLRADRLPNQEDPPFGLSMDFEAE